MVGEDNRSPDVDAWFDGYTNPQKDLVLAVRRVVLDADPRVPEAIKWQAPTFMADGNLARGGQTSAGSLP